MKSTHNKLINHVNFHPAKARPSDDITGSIPTPLEYGLGLFLEECGALLKEIEDATTLEDVRHRLAEWVLSTRIENSMTRGLKWNRRANRIRDCARTWLSLISARSDSKTGFSITGALWDLARGVDRSDLQPGFFAEMIHLTWGIEGRTRDKAFEDRFSRVPDLDGREAANARCEELDQLYQHVEEWTERYGDGLSSKVRKYRLERRQKILDVLGGDENDWADWRWQASKVCKDPVTLSSLVDLSKEELRTIAAAREARIPFGVTPFYLSLMDDAGSDADRAVRAQVFPSNHYVSSMATCRADRSEAFDFMQERNTSPIDLVTRRYPSIVILKPYNTCPQICVYCQRNWEIDDVLETDALAPWEKIEKAVRWIGEHPAVHEVLITGGDPFLMETDDLARILGMVCALPNIRRIRFGTRTPVTLPMRINDELVEMLSRFREPGRRELAVSTHVQHPYEVNPEMVEGVERLRQAGIPVYNQLVYTFYTSRRFEAYKLRRLLRQVGIDPYYSFLPKGKAETNNYRVPLSRLIQEQAEEARILPGLSRTDESVYNVPRLGKNYLNATQNRDLLSILPDGSRMYEFHPWEKNIVEQESYIGDVVPILEYLSRLQEYGDNPEDYESIWYYY